MHGAARNSVPMTHITFITGANKGLGHEATRRLIEHSQTVIIGARDPQRGRAAADELGARFVQIDVTDEASIDSAAADIKAHEGHLDTLINNAGILGSHAPADQLTGSDIAHVYETNVFSIVRVTHAFLPLLRASDHPTVINVTSGMGSFAATHDPDRVESSIAAPLYTSSKSAVTMLTTQYAKALPDVRFNAADPGYTATDFNNHSGPQTITEGTDAIVQLATEDPSAGTGRLIDRHGPAAW
jgi:NAD(P)-dependent dehydrogenase (short-subunit alcohol dehydrogenase family)